MVRKKIHLIAILACLLALAFTATLEAATERPTVTNVFADTYITEALRDVSFQTGINIIADTGVQGFVTLELDDIPFEDALRLILAPGGYAFAQLDDNTYVVGAATPGSPMFHLLSTTRRYAFNYITAESAKRLMPTEYERHVKFDPLANVAVVQASPEVADRIIADLEQIDVKPRQIMIEALVTEVSSGAHQRLGIDWSWTSPVPNGSTSHVGVNDLIGSVGYVTANGLDRFLTTLKMLVDDGEAQIRANPRVATISGKEASIFVGQQQYHKIVTGSETNPFTRLQPIDAGVSLDVRPTVGANGDITLYIEPSVSDVTGVNKDGLPQLNRRHVATTVRVRDGETIAIGGLFQTSQNELVSKVPILGDLPLLSALFRSSYTEERETEVIVLITPRIMEDD